MTIPIKTFVGLCLSQIGKPYIYGYEVNLDDPNPPAFDCSELVQWAGHRSGADIPDGSSNQLRFCLNANKGITVPDGIDTYGALLFRGNAVDPGADHVAVSLGNGWTIEARGKLYGVNRFPSINRVWTAAGEIPGYDYTGQMPDNPRQELEYDTVNETDVIDEIEVQVSPVKGYYQLQADGGVRVVGEDGKALDGVPFVDYYVVANTGQRYEFGKGKNGGVFSYPGLPEGAKAGVRYFRRIFLG